MFRKLKNDLVLLNGRINKNCIIGYVNIDILVQFFLLIIKINWFLLEGQYCRNKTSARPSSHFPLVFNLDSFIKENKIFYRKITN